MIKSEVNEKVLNIDKAKWKLTKLGTLAEDISSRVDKPSQSQYDKFVGLEDFVSGDLKIKSWSSTENLTSSAKAFKMGDILFARRNAYLRRASLVDFDGCCSGDAFVIRENHDKVVPGFLAFVMNSNSLWDYANSNAAGTMSKRVKWRDLAEYQFLLPPKDQQAQLAELLWVMDEVIEREREVLERIETTYLSKRESLISAGGFAKKCLSDLVKNLITYGIVQPGPEVHNGIPYIQSSDIKDSKIALNLSKTSNEIAESYSRSEVKPGDIIFSLRGNLGDTAIVPSDFGRTNMARGVARISLKKDNDNLYVKYALETIPVLGKILTVSQGSTFKEVSLDTLRKIKVPVPNDMNEQKEISTILEQLVKTKSLHESKIFTSKALQKSLINQIF